MPIQIPGQSQNLNATSGTAPRLPQKGQGLRQVGQGLIQAGNAANQIEQGQFQVEQSRKAAENKRIEEGLKKTRARNLLEAETTVSEIMRSHRTKIQADRRGSSAEGVTTETQEVWEKTLREVGDTLDNDDVRLLFDQRMASQRSADLDSVASYEARQLDVATAEAANGKITTSIDFAAANAGNPKAVAISRLDIIGTVDAQAKLMGWKPEQKQFELEKALGVMHRQVFENLATMSPEAAKKYFETHKAEINGSQYEDYSNILKNSEYRIGGQRLVDTLMSTQMSWEERRAAIKRTSEGQERDYALNLLEHEEGREAQAIKARQAAIENQGWNQFQATRNVTSISPVVWAQLDGKTKQVMEDLQKIPQERILTNTPTYMGLWNQASADPDSFLAQDLRLYANQLNKVDYERLAGIQQKISEGRNADVRSFTQQLDSATSGMKEADAKTFHSLAEDKILDMEQSLKRKVTPEERKKAINELRSEVTWSANRGGLGILDAVLGPAQYKATVGDIILDPETQKNLARGFDIADVPETEKDLIEQAMKGRNIPITNDAIIRTYLKSLGVPVK